MLPSRSIYWQIIREVEGVCPIMKLERLVSKLIHQKRQHQFLIKRLCPTEADATMHSCSCTPVDTGQKNAPPCNIVEPEIGSKSSAVSLVVISFKENSQKRILCPRLHHQYHESIPNTNIASNTLLDIGLQASCLVNVSWFTLKS
ncbi:uncharacterized protein [Apostichopus japonicus]|uniref:uncharacterized protein isoform X2 n=1 Tax=Stichopus japonicus TaxID=307972 RepID=UPI003AB585AB